MCVLVYYFYLFAQTWLDLSPAVGVWSLGFDSGMGSWGSSKWMPDQPTHNPLPRITTGHTAVTNPPALKY